ncbi:glutaminase [Bacteroidia bacterium]|nr:glutaminase [Bacteroidia bacterium]
MMKYLFSFICIFGLFGCHVAEKSDVQLPAISNSLRAPAYPLVTIDPYTSAWSVSDNLYDDQVKHWTNKDFPLIGAIRVDGTVYRFMGIEKKPMKAIASISTEKDWTGKYTFDKPQKGWEKPAFNDSQWKEGQAAWGTPEEMNVNTLWQTKDIWVRRDIQLEKDLTGEEVFLKYSHDDTFELYINGIQVVGTDYSWKKDVWITLNDEVKATLKAGKNVISAHCNNRTGGGLVDFGLYLDDDIETYLTATAVQKSVDVQATQTYYQFDCGDVELTLSFLAPLFLDNLELVSRPVNYLSYSIRSLDAQAHDVQIYFESAPNWALNSPNQENAGEGFEKDGLVFLKTGSTAQKILGKKGDDVRIDWGYFYLSSEGRNATYNVGDPYQMRSTFVQTGKLAKETGTKANGYLAISKEYAKTKSVSDKIMLGYDDIYSIQYFDENLRPYWNRKGNKTIEQAFVEANKDFASLSAKATAFDHQLMSKAKAAGGQQYAELCALAYRQSISAHKLVEAPNGDLLFLSKENNSNGSIGTVDITYPSSPLFLIYNPELAKGLMNHIFFYSESGKWVKPFPSHDVGTYPWANGQTYGADMPLEEAGNMLTLTAAIAAVEGNALYAEKHWAVLTVWADYLVEKGLDPENQLCTDDFAGHFAHNVNLSVKAIMGIASYGYLAEKSGKKEVAEKYTGIAKEMAQKWMEMADNGDHYRLTFDQPDTWSQKYNLIWDKLLQLNIFPKTVAQKEIAYYLTKQNEYGLPLDSRRNYSKSDWIIWTATLADDTETFGKFIAPLHKFYNETTDRVPMSDWYNTDSKTHVGFIARSVVGGYYAKLLEEKGIGNQK